MEKELTEVRSEDHQKRKKQKRKKWFVRKKNNTLIPVVSYGNKDNMSISYRRIKFYV